MLPHGPSGTYDALFSLSGAVQALFLLLVALLIVGSAGLKSVREVLQIPKPRFLGWTCGIGVVLGFLIPTLQYLYERAHWAAFDFGRTGPPQFSAVTFHDSWLTAFGLIVIAICEEIVIRGLLQPKLLDRFGMHRGIVFTAAIWGTYEFHLRTFARYSIPDLLIAIGVFFGTHLALSYLYAWAYLKSGSIVPTIVLHAILSLSTIFKVELDFPGAEYARPFLWAVGTLVLFHVWPVDRRIVPPIEMTDANPSPAS
ncbi:MAG: CPBP family intramembrane metalloprotease [Acidobacteria bacterium]|nr:CPBP family intramembrane metalloprotease [Acidobacteriota bacterium]